MRLRAKLLWWWVLERLLCSKVRLILVRSQVHIKVDLVPIQSHVFDHVTEVGGISHEVQVTIGGRIHGLTTLSAPDDPLEFALLCTQLAACVFYFAEFLVRVRGAVVVVARKDGTLLL